MKKRRFNFSGIAALIISLLVLVAIVPINIIANYYDKNFDMTPSNMYTLSSTTKTLLSDTKDKEIEIYFLWDLNELRDLPEYLPLYHNLTELDSYDNIKVIDFKADEDPELAESLSSNGNLNVSDADIIVKCGDTIKRISSQKIFPYDSDGISTYAGEELMAGAIKIVTAGNLPNIYFLTGHGEKTIDDSYSTFSGILKSDNYAATELDLDKVDAVPDDAAILFIAAPQEDISDNDKEKILSYAQTGGSLAFFLPPNDADFRYTNIEEILAEYDLGMDYNIVKETSNDRIMNNNLSESDPYTFNVVYTEATDDFTEDLTSEINTLVEAGTIGGISNTRSLYQISNGINTQYLEKSSIVKNSPDDTTALFTTISEPCGGDDETAKAAETLSNCELELGFYSYNKQTGSKLIVLGTDSIMDQDVVSASVSLSQQLVLNTVTWLYNSDIDMEIGNKGASYDYMSFDSAESATSTLKIFTIVPIFIAVIGLLVWLKRRHS